MSNQKGDQTFTVGAGFPGDGPAKSSGPSSREELPADKTVLPEALHSMKADEDLKAELTYGGPTAGDSKDAAADATSKAATFGTGGHVAGPDAAHGPLQILHQTAALEEYKKAVEDLPELNQDGTKKE